MAFISGVQDELRVQYPFKSAESYSICVETAMPTVSISDSHILDNQLCAHVGFVLQEEMEKDLEAEAVALARGADIAIVFVGNTYQWESEGQDMNAMVLPPYNTRVQDSLVAAVAAANPNTVVVNTTGVPVELPWLPNIAGLLQVWYAGQEAGNAVLDVLIGRVSPSGKLPVSWPRLYEHTACYGNFGLDSYDTREVEYVEDVFVGYRHFDRHWKTDKEVVFPFGHGLSYTKFEISDVSVCGRIRNDPDEVVTVTAHIKNVGALTGSESLQVYVAPPEVSGVERPIKSLAGFAKVHLQPQEERVVTVEFKRDAAAFWDEGLKSWRVAPGQHTVTLATSSKPDDVKGSSVVLVEADFTFAP